MDKNSKLGRSAGTDDSSYRFPQDAVDAIYANAIAVSDEYIVDLVERQRFRMSFTELKTLVTMLNETNSLRVSDVEYLNQLQTMIYQIRSTKDRGYATELINKIGNIIIPHDAYYERLNPSPVTFRQHNVYYIKDFNVDFKAVSSDPLFWWQQCDLALVDTMGQVFTVLQKDTHARNLQIQLGYFSTLNKPGDENAS